MLRLVELLGSLDSDPSVERRTSRRTRVTCDATLRTLTGEYAGKLWDISEHGARLELPLSPEAGTTARLSWAGHEAVCRVVWSEADMCGVSFDTALAEAIVVETAERNRIVDLPIAQVGNIAPGRRRSATLSLVSGAHVEASSLGEQVPSQWTVAFPARRQGAISVNDGTLPAAQAMFFYGAPLARIVAREAWTGPSGA